MAEERILGYNCRLKIQNKLLAGATQDDLDISAVTKDSITKDDAGNKKSAIVGHEVTFSVSGIVTLGATAGTHLSRDEIIALSLLTGDDATVGVEYVAGNGAAYEGDAVITRYSEGSGSEEEATYGLNLKISGSFTLKKGT